MAILVAADHSRRQCGVRAAKSDRSIGAAAITVPSAPTAIARTPADGHPRPISDVPVIGSQTWSRPLSPTEAIRVPPGAATHSRTGLGTIRVWDVPVGQCVRSLTGHSNSVNALALPRATDTVISASRDRTVRVWALSRPPEASRPAGHTDFVRGLAEASGSGLVVSASDDSIVRVWAPRTGRCLRTPAGHDGGVWVVAVLPDGRTALSGSEDHTLRLWGLPTGRLLRVLEGTRKRSARSR